LGIQKDTRGAPPQLHSESLQDRYGTKKHYPFWVAKFEKNVARDSRVASSLKDLGWHFFIVWEF
jgi:G:T-mismatch repair DNA endonuclease (very short patch repair protein)